MWCHVGLVLHVLRSSHIIGLFDILCLITGCEYMEICEVTYYLMIVTDSHDVQTRINF